MIHISLAAEKIFSIGPLTVTNSLLMSWLAVLVVCVLAYFGTRRREIVPRGFQNFFEMIIEALLGLIQSITENRKQAIQLLPLIATFFIIIAISNWMGLLPGVGSIGIYEEYAHASETVAHASVNDDYHPDTTFIPLFRSAYSDINMTMAISLISVIVTQFLGIAAIGFFKYTKKFINFSGIVPFFLGILELIGEVAHFISFSFRLFGNVFAGEVLLVVIAFLVAYGAPIPFYFLEIFIGFVQALVFSLLTLVFIKTATTAHEAH